MSRAKAKSKAKAHLSKSKMECNKPKRTKNHPTKSHVVKACKGGKEKIIRFGQQGVKGAGANPKTAKIKHVKNPIMQDIMHRIQSRTSLVHVTGRIKSNGNSISW